MPPRARRDYAPSVRPRPEPSVEVHEKPPERSDYAPSVRARAMREGGQRRLTPNYPDPSEVKHLFFSDPSGSTDRQTIITPSTGRKVRLLRVKVYQIATDGKHFCEVYFGTGASISTDATKAIDYLAVPDLSEGSTRTWGRGAGPVGLKNEVLSIRWTGSPATSHKFIVEYTEER